MNLDDLTLTALLDQAFWSAIQILMAFLIALPIAFDRERGTRSMGLRTFPIVSMTSCGFVLIGLSSLGSNGEMMSRIMQGLIMGVGFIGGGAILKNHGNVQGTATAASLWNTSAIGAAVAFNRYDLALILSLINFLALRLMKPLKTSLDSKE
jgi:putative Mg2+ transporter-C (MgtC) family protein